MSAVELFLCVVVPVCLTVLGVVYIWMSGLRSLLREMNKNEKEDE